MSAVLTSQGTVTIGLKRTDKKGRLVAEMKAKGNKKALAVGLAFVLRTVLSVASAKDCVQCSGAEAPPTPMERSCGNESDRVPLPVFAQGIVERVLGRVREKSPSVGEDLRTRLKNGEKREMTPEERKIFVGRFDGCADGRISYVDSALQKKDFDSRDHSVEESILRFSVACGGKTLGLRLLCYEVYNCLNEPMAQRRCYVLL